MSENEIKVLLVHGPLECECACSGCDGAHHWIEDCVEEPVKNARRDSFDGGHLPEIGAPYLLCKHCDAWAEYPDWWGENVEFRLALANQQGRTMLPCNWQGYLGGAGYEDGACVSDADTGWWDSRRRVADERGGCGAGDADWSTAMSDGTGISWADATWNPVVGCTRVSAGCDHCYAVTMTHRLGCAAEADEKTGRDPGRKRPYLGLTVLNGRGERHFNGVVRCVEEALPLPMKWRMPRRIFVNSMGDLFHRDVPFEFIDRVFAIMALCPQHTFRVLTKRPERMVEYLGRVKRDRGDAWNVAAAAIEAEAWRMIGEPGCMGLVHTRLWPLPNVQLGVSAEDQATWLERVGHLLRCPAAVRFVSCEPLLGPITFSIRGDGNFTGYPPYPSSDEQPKNIHQVIVGGESGAKARPCDVAWMRSIRDQCAAAGVACWVKQLGARIAVRNDEFSQWPNDGDSVIYDAEGPGWSYQGETVVVRTNDRAGADMAEWPEDLRVQQWPEVK